MPLAAFDAYSMHTLARVVGASAIAWTVLASTDLFAGATEYEEFKIAAGTTILVEMKSPVGSDSNRTGDTISGLLAMPLLSGDTELVPSGAMVFGSVGDVRGPDRDSGPGRIELRFTIIEHPETRSRVRIRTTAATFDGERVKARKFGLPATRLTDARVAPGTVVSVTLVEPFVVKIPKTKSGS